MQVRLRSWVKCSHVTDLPLRDARIGREEDGPPLTGAEPEQFHRLRTSSRPCSSLKLTPNAWLKPSSSGFAVACGSGRLPTVVFAPLPEDGPALPIWVGGSSPGALRRAGRLGDAWHPVGSSPDDVRRLTPAVSEAAETAGRPRPLVAPRLAIEFDGADIHPALVGRIPGVRGDEQTVVDRLRVYAEAGADEIICLFGTPDGEEVVRRMERFARGVMPLIRATPEWGGTP